MATRFEETIALMERDGAHGYAQYLRDLHTSHEALLKAAKDVNNSLELDWDALKEAIHVAEELGK